MKITKEKLLEIIKEELNEIDGLGRSTVSRSDSATKLKQRSREVSDMTGVDNVERGIIDQIETNLTKLADLDNIKMGTTFALLTKIDSVLRKKIEELEAKQDEG